MKLKNIIAIAFIAILAVGGIVALTTDQEAQEMPTAQQVSTGSLEFYPDFASQYITPRNVAVWLPDGYSVGDSCQVI